MNEAWLLLPYWVDEPIKFGEDMLAPLELVGLLREEKTDNRRERRWLMPRVGEDQLSKEMMDMGRDRGGPWDVIGASERDGGAVKGPS
jgi:hypothetical protein